MNFVVCQMNYMPLYIPLIIEGNKRGIESKIFLQNHNKYGSPHNFIDEINNLSQEFNFVVKSYQEINNNPSDITFFVEGGGLKGVKYKTKKAILTLSTDFRVLYKNYQKQADFIFFNGRSVFDNPGSDGIDTNFVSPNNYYIGSPKYDISIDDKKILLEKYNLLDEDNILIIYPRTRDLNKIDIEKIDRAITSSGYTTIIKARKKEACSYHCKRLFYDKTIYPHTTMELLAISKLAINFSSTAIEEIVCLNTPVINFDIKPYKILMPYLYKYDYCKNLNSNISENELTASINQMVSMNYEKDFKQSKSEHFGKTIGVSKDILDLVLAK